MALLLFEMFTLLDSSQNKTSQLFYLLSSNLSSQHTYLRTHSMYVPNPNYR